MLLIRDSLPSCWVLAFSYRQFWSSVSVAPFLLPHGSWVLVSCLIRDCSVCVCVCAAGLALQIQCYQCEMTDDCAAPEFIVNCTVNVQDMCQKEVLMNDDGILYRKSCASSSACLISSSGYQQFCTGKLHSVCISCCSTPLCNGPRQKRRPPPLSGTAPARPPLLMLVLLLLDSILC
ncbi:ly6/PLAUR domain-containing protein 1 isoform X1 [Xiphophorus maculatus]|uniref:ly6/PLAUR domain-containing protein 1 isoform X1 n=1 Tax=Xiphophorus maculatus TaxID=8083 RepID=UPI000C6E2C83|nr:ly6/PLAUR domain-containing protein 1 isoform X1 [Xiphophorus maculatus]